MRPSRSLYPNGFKVGNSLGKPGMRELQKEVLKDALGLLTKNTRPGSVETKDYPAYGDYFEAPSVRAK